MFAIVDVYMDAYDRSFSLFSLSLSLPLSLSSLSLSLFFPSKILSFLDFLCFRFTKDKLFAWIKKILAREVNEATYHTKEGLYHTHGPLDLFTNINNALDVAVEEHLLRGKALVRLFSSYAHAVNYFQNSQLRTLGSAKVTPPNHQ